MRNPRSHRGSGSGREGGRSESVEASAPTVDEAIIKALTELRSTKERTRIEVLDPGKSKLLGLFGGRPARVRATLRPAMPGDRPERTDRGDRGPRPDRERQGRPERPERGDRGDRGPRGERRDRPDRDRDRDREQGPREERPAVSNAERSAQVLSKAKELLQLMGVEAPIQTEERSGELWLKLESGPSDGLLIGRRGETLTALEHLLSRMSSLHERERVKVVLDVAGYRSRRTGSEDEDEAGEAGEERPAREGREGREGRRRDRGRRGEGRRERVESAPLTGVSEPEMEEFPEMVEVDEDEPVMEGRGINGNTMSDEPEIAPAPARAAEPEAGSDDFDDFPGPRRGRERDRGDRGGRGRDRDRGPGPDIEMTPEMVERMREHKRLEQEIIQRASVGPAVPEVPQPGAGGPKMPTFRRPDRPKRRGYRPDDTQS
jgi:spoIIIJ-associated protein